MSATTIPITLENKFLLNREEVAEFLRVSQRTADNLIRRGEIKSIRIGGSIRGRVLVPRAALLRFAGVSEGTNNTR